MWEKMEQCPRTRCEILIFQGFLADESISFCMNFLDQDENPGLPVNKHLGRLDGYGHIEGKRVMHVDYECRRPDFNRANLVALQHLEVVDPWLEEHKSFIAKQYSDRGQERTDAEITREHNSRFTQWFKEKILANPPKMPCSEEEKLLLLLSQGPAHNLMTFQSYDINGYTFYTEEKDKTCQNCEYELRFKRMSFGANFRTLETTSSFVDGKPLPWKFDDQEEEEEGSSKDQA